MANRKPSVGITQESFEKYSVTHINLISQLLDEAEKSRVAAIAFPAAANSSKQSALPNLKAVISNSNVSTVKTTDPNRIPRNKPIVTNSRTILGAETIVTNNSVPAACIELHSHNSSVSNDQSVSITMPTSDTSVASSTTLAPKVPVQRRKKKSHPVHNIWRERFNAEEHRYYLQLLLHSRANPRLIKPQDCNKFQALNEDEKKRFWAFHPKVVKAQKDFLNESRNSVSSNVVFKLTVEQREFTKKHYKYCCERALQYSPYYQIIDNVQLTASVDMNTEKRAEFNYIDTYLEMGTVPYFIMPKFNQRTFIPQEFNRIEKRYPVVKKHNSKGVPFKPVISRDSIAEKMALKYRAHVVLSQSSLKTLFANSSRCLQNGWVLPVTVRDSHRNVYGGKPQKVVYIDKAFREKDDSIISDYMTYEKRAVKMIVLHPNHKKVHHFGRSKHEPPKERSAVGDTESNVPDCQSNLASAESSKPSVAVVEDHVRYDFVGIGEIDDCSEIDDDDKLVIDDERNSHSDEDCEMEKPANDQDIMNKLYGMERNDNEVELPTVAIETFNSRERKRKHSEEEEMNGTPFSSKMRLTGGETVNPTFKPPITSSDKSGHMSQDGTADISHETERLSDNGANLDVNEGDYVQPGENVTYQLWQLDDLRLLVRCSVDGSTVVDNKTYFWKIEPKLEFRPHIGGEQVTYAECAKQWISTAIIPKCKFARIRISAFSHMVLGVEQLTCAETVLPSTPFNPPDCLDLMSTTLQKLCSLTEGSYLLSHGSGESFYKILKGIPNDDGSSKVEDAYNLHAVQRVRANSINSRKASDMVPWRPIDRTILLFGHLRKNRIPVIPSHVKKNAAKRKKKKTKKIPQK